MLASSNFSGKASGSSCRESFRDELSSGRFSTYSSSELNSSSRLSSFGSIEIRAPCRFRATFCCLDTIFVHDGTVHCLALSEEDLIFSGSDNGQIIVCKQILESGNCTYPVKSKIRQGDGSVKALLPMSLSNLVFTAHQDSKIRVWRSAGTEEDPHATDFELSATLPTVRDRLIHCLLPTNYDRVRRHKTCLRIQHNDTVSCLAYCRSHQEAASGIIYSCSWDRTVKVWRASDLKCLDSFKAHDDAINAVAARDGYIYTGSADSKVKVWVACRQRRGLKHRLVSDLEDTRVRPSSVNALAWSGNGALLYAGMSDSSIAVWERKLEDSCHMSLLGRLKGHRRPVLCLAAARDILCSGSADFTVRIWKTECCLGVLKGHTGPVKCLAVAAVFGRNSSPAPQSSPAYLEEFEDSDMDVFRVYSGSTDKKIKIWKVSVSRFPSSELEDSVSSNMFNASTTMSSQATVYCSQDKVQTLHKDF